MRRSAKLSSLLEDTLSNMKGMRIGNCSAHQGLQVASEGGSNISTKSYTQLQTKSKLLLDTRSQKALSRMMQYLQKRPYSSLEPTALRMADLGKGKKRAGAIRTTLFCAGLSASAFGLAAIREESMLRHEWHRWKERSIFGQLDPPAWINSAPALIQNLYKEFWLDVSPAQRTVGVIIGLNTAVFMAMRSHAASIRRFMDANFLHNLPPWPNRLITLCTSNFTHKSTGHFAFNMIALWSFGVSAASVLGVNQFLGFYLTAGLSSGLLSDLGRLRSLPGGFSLGASGAVYACFALVAMTMPETEVVLIFVPTMPFNIADALSGMMALDIAGALLGWRLFDHWGHLGGALFGVYYALRGYQEIWPRFQAMADKVLDRTGTDL